MGQQQQTTMESVVALRRIMLVVLVAAFMALMMTVTAAPALAANKGSFELGAKIAANQSNDNNALKGVLKAEANHNKNN